MKTFRKFALAVATVLAVSLAGVAPSFAAVDMFIKFSADDGEVLNQATDPAQGIFLGQPDTDLNELLNTRVSELTVRRELDRASPVLAHWAQDGKHFRTLNIYVPAGRSGSDGYYQYELTNVRVTGYTAHGDAGDRPTEEVVFDYGGITLVAGPSSRLSR